MSRYLVNKFLFTVDRDTELTERYRADPIGLVAEWERTLGPSLLNSVEVEQTTWSSFSDEERQALEGHDHVALFEMGAHPFLTLTLWIAMFERDFGEPLGMQLDYAAKLAHLGVQPYPSIDT